MSRRRGALEEGRMKVAADVFVQCLLGAAAAGSLVTFFVMSRAKFTISRANLLSVEIHRRIENLADFCDLTDVQMKQIIGLQTLAGPPRRLANLDEIFGYYLWAANSGLDPIGGSALAIICEKCLGLTQQDALRAMRQAKSADDYKTLLPSRNHGRLDILN